MTEKSISLEEPYEMAMRDELSRSQFYANAQRMAAELRQVRDAPAFTVSEDANGSIVSQLCKMGYYHGQRVRIVPAGDTT